MSRRFSSFLVGVLCLFLFPQMAPAPLVYREGEGWTYEPAGGRRWIRQRAKDQVEAAQTAYDQKDFRVAAKAARRTVKVWPMSDYAPQAQYLLARSLQAQGEDQKAFKAYQKALEKFPKYQNFVEVQQRQYEIADRFLAGKRFKLWGFIPFLSSMQKTAEMYEKLVKNGPYSEVAPQAQLKMGAAREKRKDYPLAVKAYEVAADRYHDRPEVAAEALYRAGLAYQKQAKTAEYDQNVAAQAIATFSDFISLYPQDRRVEEARKIIESLKTEQARGSFAIASYYEKRGRWDGALVYYNEVLLRDPNYKEAERAKQKIESLKKRTALTAN